MTGPPLPKILVVDDEEAILETMSFTFEDEYEVLTCGSAVAALELVDEHAPIAAVISDQRMPEMTGVEFLAKVFEHHPTTVRIILTGFADMDATIGAINDGHVYAYVTKPWEPDELKQIVRRAVEHHHLAAENERLLHELRDANVFLEAVVDQLDTGAIAIDAAGVVRATNRPARSYLGLGEDPRGRELKEIVGCLGLDEVMAAATRVASDEEAHFEELELALGDQNLRLRIRVQTAMDPEGRELGRVILLREISHEPLARRYEEIVDALARQDGTLREPLSKAQAELQGLADETGAGATSTTPGMAELAERAARTATAIDYWLAVDDSMAGEDFPDAQLLMDRMRVASSRWPDPERMPEKVRELALRVEAYYDSGEHSKQRTL